MTINITLDATNVYSINIPDPNDFLFDEKVYADALKLVNDIDRAWPTIKKDVINSNLVVSEDGTIAGDFIVLSDILEGRYADKLLFGVAPLRRLTNAQYAPHEPSLNGNAAIVLSNRAKNVAGNTLPRQTKWYLFHELVHHIDTVDNRPFTDGMVWDDNNATRYEKYYAYFNTPHEQRAYFYTAVFSMTETLSYRLAKKIGLMKHRSVFNFFVGMNVYFDRFNAEALTPSNHNYHIKRLDDLFIKLSK